MSKEIKSFTFIGKNQNDTAIKNYKNQLDSLFGTSNFKLINDQEVFYYHLPRNNLLIFRQKSHKSLMLIYVTEEIDNVEEYILKKYRGW